MEFDMKANITDILHVSSTNICMKINKFSTEFA